MSDAWNGKRRKPNSRDSDSRSGIIAVRERFPISDMYKSLRVARSALTRARIFTRTHAHTWHWSFWCSLPFFPPIPRKFVGSSTAHHVFHCFCTTSARPAEHVFAFTLLRDTRNILRASNVLFALFPVRLSLLGMIRLDICRLLLPSSSVRRLSRKNAQDREMNQVHSPLHWSSDRET